MLLRRLALVLSVAAATNIHDERRVPFFRAGKLLPEEVEDQIWKFYPEILYGDHPQSPILSLKESQALLPPLNFSPFGSNLWRDHYYISKSRFILPQNRYFTLHLIDDSQDRDVLHIAFKGNGESCRLSPRYILANETIHESTYGGPAWGEVLIDKQTLNREMEHGTALLLHIPQGCNCTVDYVARFIRVPESNWYLGPFRTIRVSDEVQQPSWVSQIIQACRHVLNTFTGIIIN